MSNSYIQINTQNAGSYSNSLIFCYFAVNQYIIYSRFQGYKNKTWNKNIKNWKLLKRLIIEYRLDRVGGKSYRVLRHRKNTQGYITSGTKELIKFCIVIRHFKIFIVKIWIYMTSE